MSCLLTMTLQLYLDSVYQALSTKNGVLLRDLLSLYPKKNIPSGPEQAAYSPSQFDLYKFHDFSSVITSHLSMMTSIYTNKLIISTFNNLNIMCNHLIKFSHSQSNYINVPLINSLNELLAVYRVRLKSYPESELEYGMDIVNGNNGGNVNNGDLGLNASASVGSASFTNSASVGGLVNSHSSSSDPNSSNTTSLEAVANTLNKAFKTSLNDKNSIKSRRDDIYYFLSQLIKIYYIMQKFDLAKSIEKAIVATKFTLPPIEKNKNHSIPYLYYSAILALDDGEFLIAESKLDKAVELIQSLKNYENTPQWEKILFILLPIKLYFNKIPKPFIWKFQLIKLVYLELTNSILTGNLKIFDLCVKKFELIFLQKHLYLLLQLLKQNVYTNLIKKITKFVQELNTSSPSPSHIIPLSSYQIGFEISLFHNFKSVDWSTHDSYYSQNEIECIIANLISIGKIKGYLSHGNKCLVLSKTTPFP